MRDFGPELRLISSAVLDSTSTPIGTCFAVDALTALTARHVLRELQREFVGATVNARSADGTFREYNVVELSENDIASLTVGRHSPAHASTACLGYLTSVKTGEDRYQTYGVAGDSGDLVPVFASWQGAVDRPDGGGDLVAFKCKSAGSGYSGAAIIDRCTGNVIGMVTAGQVVDSSGRYGERVNAVPAHVITRNLGSAASWIKPGIESACYATAISSSQSELCEAQMSYTSARRLLVDGRVHDEQEIFALMQESADTVWCINGGSGIGKTELVRNLCWQACATLLARDSTRPPVIPVLIAMRQVAQWNPSDVNDLERMLGGLASSLSVASIFSVEPRFSKWAEAFNGRLLLIFDGVDEKTGSSRLDATKVVQALLRDPTLRSRHILVVTSRTTDLPSALAGGPLRSIVVQPIRDVAKYLTRRRLAGKHLSKDSESLIQRLPEDCQGRPLFLELACSLDSDAPSTVTVPWLYHAYVSRLLGKLTDELSLSPPEQAFAVDFLQELAYVAWWKGVDDADLLKDAALDTLRPQWEKALPSTRLAKLSTDLLSRMAALRAVISQHKRRVLWQHVSLLEYLTAESLKRKATGVDELLSARATVGREVASFLLSLEHRDVREALVTRAVQDVGAKELRCVVARAAGLGVPLDQHADNLASLLMRDLEGRFSGDDACNVLWVIYGGGLVTELERLCDLGGTAASQFLFSRMQAGGASWIVQRAYAKTLIRLRGFQHLVTALVNRDFSTTTRLWCAGALAQANEWRFLCVGLRKLLAERDPLQSFVIQMLRRRFGDTSVERMLRVSRQPGDWDATVAASQFHSISEITHTICESTMAELSPDIVLWQCIRVAEAGDAKCMRELAVALGATRYWGLIERVLCVYEFDQVLHELRTHAWLGRRASATLQRLGATDLPTRARQSDFDESRADETEDADGAEGASSRAGMQRRLTYIHWQQTGRRALLIKAIEESDEGGLADTCIAVDALAALGAEKSLHFLATQAKNSSLTREILSRTDQRWDIWVARMAALIGEERYVW